MAFVVALYGSILPPLITPLQEDISNINHAKLKAEVMVLDPTDNYPPVQLQSFFR